MSRKIVLTLALAAMIVAAQPLRADDFHRVARGLRTLGFERTWIPFMGLARTFVKIAHPKGVHDFQIAVYEKTPDVTGEEVERMIKSRIARGFSPLVRVYSSRRGESVFIYARPSRDNRTVELIVLSHEPNETVLVRVTADAEKVGRELGVPEKVGQIASH
jgi:Domain of unknown function (DUF4252)